MIRGWLGLVVGAAMIVLAGMVYGRLPEEIATHFNDAGEPELWMARGPWAFMAPAVAVGFWLLLRLVAWVGSRIEGRREVWETYWLLGNLLLVFIALLQLHAIGSVLGWPVDSTHLSLAMVGVLFVGLGLYFPTAPYGWWLAVRTPWALVSERVWRATHRLAGKTFPLGGAITLGAIAVPADARPWVALVGMAIGGFVPIVHSFVAARREEAGSIEAR